MSAKTIKKEPDKWTMLLAVTLYKKAEKIKKRLRKTMPHVSEKELKNKSMYLAFVNMLLDVRKKSIEEIKHLILRTKTMSPVSRSQNG